MPVLKRQRLGLHLRISILKMTREVKQILGDVSNEGSDNPYSTILRRPHAPRQGITTTTLPESPLRHPHEEDTPHRP
jgi:hypothetical protein